MKTYTVSSGAGFVTINDMSFHGTPMTVIRKGDKVLIVANGEGIIEAEYTQFLNGDDGDASFASIGDLITYLNSVFNIGGGDGIGVIRESNTVIFDNDYVIGEAGARTGDVIIDVTSPRRMAVTTMLHNDASPFQFFQSDGVTPFVFSSEIGFYESGVDNYLDFQYLWPGKVRLTISQ